MTLKIRFLILFVCQFIQAQKSEMTVNKNRYNPNFKAQLSLKKEFKNKESIAEFKLIIKSKGNGEISVLIQNNTYDTISLARKDRNLYILQEAKDKNGLWKPIEYWESSHCGNSFGKVKIEPNGIIETKTVEYKGVFKTKIRFKLSANNKVFYSNSLKGNISSKKMIILRDFTSIYPLSVRRNKKDKTPIELQKKVVFLEPNGTEEFINYMSNH